MRVSTELDGKRIVTCCGKDHEYLADATQPLRCSECGRLLPVPGSKGIHVWVSNDDSKIEANC